MSRAFLRTLSMLSWGCSWTCDGSGSSSTKWRRDSTSLLVKFSTGFRSSTTRSNGGKEREKRRVQRRGMFGQRGGERKWWEFKREQIVKKTTVDQKKTPLISYSSPKHKRPQSVLPVKAYLVYCVRQEPLGTRTLVSTQSWLFSFLFFFGLSAGCSHRRAWTGFWQSLITDRCLTVLSAEGSNIYYTGYSWKRRRGTQYLYIHEEI